MQWEDNKCEKKSSISVVVKEMQIKISQETFINNGKINLFP